MTTSLGFLQHNLWDTAKINQVSPSKFTTSSPTYVLRLLTNCSLIPIQGWVSEYKSLAFVSTCPIKEGDCTSDHPNIAFRARDCNNAVTKQYKGAKGFTAMTFREENSKSWPDCSIYNRTGIPRLDLVVNYLVCLDQHPLSLTCSPS